MNSMLLKPSSKPWTPHNYQKKAVKFLIAHGAAALFLDPGLGKTSITLAALTILKKKKLLGKVLLIAPLRVCHSVWPRELDKWSDFKGLSIAVLHGSQKYRAELLERDDVDIYVINPEGLEWLLQIEKVTGRSGKVKITLDIRRWKKLGFTDLVIDELSNFKNHGSIRFKSMKLILHTFNRRWGLTGSPAANGLMGLFSQCYMLDQGNALGQYITGYRNNYFIPGHDGFSWDLRNGADEEIYKRISPFVLRMAANDYLELPQLVENIIKVELDVKTMEVYRELERDLITKIDTKVVTAATAAVASSKCRQVANGAIYTNSDVQALVKLPKSKKEWVDLHNAKLDALECLIDELQGSPLLVAYDFGHDLSRLQGRFGRDIPYIGGGVPIKRSTELERLWNTGRLPVLFGHPMSMSHGLNLQEVGNHVCWFSPTWDYELNDQFTRRVLRQGNKHKKVFVHYILARDTIDEVVFNAVKCKQSVQNSLFDGLKKLSRSRK